MNAPRFPVHRESTEIDVGTSWVGLNAPFVNVFNTERVALLRFSISKNWECSTQIVIETGQRKLSLLHQQHVPLKGSASAI